MDSYLQLNNAGVSLLCAGRAREALVKFSHCLSLVKSMCVANMDSKWNPAVGCINDDVPCKLVHHSEPRDDQCVCNASVQILPAGTVDDTLNFKSGNNSTVRVHRANLMSIILYNLALAHHALAMETRVIENGAQVHVTSCNETVSCVPNDLASQDSMLLFRKTLVLYGLCRSALEPSTSDDIFLSIVIFNNMGEIYKEIEGLTSHGARSCSEALVQIFMYYALKGDEPEMAQELGDILVNAYQAQSGGCSGAPAA